MKQVENIEIIGHEWKPSDIAFIRRLEINDNNLTIDCLSQMRKQVTNWPDISKPFREIKISFNVFSNLKLEFNGSKIQQIMGFDIIDASDNGWEGVNFQIEDYENDIIRFNCRIIRIVSISGPELVLFE